MIPTTSPSCWRTLLASPSHFGCRMTTPLPNAPSTQRTSSLAFARQHQRSDADPPPDLWYAPAATTRLIISEASTPAGAAAARRTGHILLDTPRFLTPKTLMKLTCTPRLDPLES